MSSKASARSEQSAPTVVGTDFPTEFSPSPSSGHQQTNLASLSREEALTRARIAGRNILGDAEAIQPFADQIFLNWSNAHIPVAVGQSDEVFGELVDTMHDEFFAGLSEGIEKFVSTPEARCEQDIFDRIEALLAKESAAAWSIHNVLSFMVYALDDDAANGLPVKCTLVDLHEASDKLASSLMNLTWKVRHE